MKILESPLCCTLVVVEERPPHMIAKRFGCTTIHNKALYKCFIHSFMSAFGGAEAGHSICAAEDLSGSCGLC